MKQVNFRVDEKKWDLFKKITKINNSDSNKELRKMIDEYLKKHSQLQF